MFASVINYIFSEREENEQSTDAAGVKEKDQVEKNVERAYDELENISREKDCKKNLDEDGGKKVNMQESISNENERSWAYFNCGDIPTTDKSNVKIKDINEDKKKQTLVSENIQNGEIDLNEKNQSCNCENIARKPNRAGTAQLTMKTDGGIDNRAFNACDLGGNDNPAVLENKTTKDDFEEDSKIEPSIIDANSIPLSPANVVTEEILISAENCDGLELQEKNIEERSMLDKVDEENEEIAEEREAKNKVIESVSIVDCLNFSEHVSDAKTMKVLSLGETYVINKDMDNYEYSNVNQNGNENTHDNSGEDERYKSNVEKVKFDNNNFENNPGDSHGNIYEKAARHDDIGRVACQNNTDTLDNYGKATHGNSSRNASDYIATQGQTDDDASRKSSYVYIDTDESWNDCDDVSSDKEISLRSQQAYLSKNSTPSSPSLLSLSPMMPLITLPSMTRSSSLIPLQSSVFAPSFLRDVTNIDSSNDTQKEHQKNFCGVHDKRGDAACRVNASRTEKNQRSQDIGNNQKMTTEENQVAQQHKAQYKIEGKSEEEIEKGKIEDIVINILDRNIEFSYFHYAKHHLHARPLHSVTLVSEGDNISTCISIAETLKLYFPDLHQTSIIDHKEKENTHYYDNSYYYFDKVAHKMRCFDYKKRKRVSKTEKEIICSIKIMLSASFQKVDTTHPGYQAPFFSRHFSYKNGIDDNSSLPTSFSMLNEIACTYLPLWENAKRHDPDKAHLYISHHIKNVNDARPCPDDFHEYPGKTRNNDYVVNKENLETLSMENEENVSEEKREGIKNITEEKKNKTELQQSMLQTNMKNERMMQTDLCNNDTPRKENEDKNNSKCDRSMVWKKKTNFHMKDNTKTSEYLLQEKEVQLSFKEKWKEEQHQYTTWIDRRNDCACTTDLQQNKNYEKTDDLTENTKNDYNVENNQHDQAHSDSDLSGFKNENFFKDQQDTPLLSNPPYIHTYTAPLGYNYVRLGGTTYFSSPYTSPYFRSGVSSHSQ